jgi:hypothetical protein
MRMRLLVEILVIGALIYLGWDTPFKQWAERANTTIQTHLRPKQPSPPGVMMIVTPIASAREQESVADS